MIAALFIGTKAEYGRTPETKKKKKKKTREIEYTLHSKYLLANARRLCDREDRLQQYAASAKSIPEICSYVALEKMLESKGEGGKK